ncbi:hypothetical protein JG687_00019607, partial [Phytophthora cactorum]
MNRRLRYQQALLVLTPSFCRSTLGLHEDATTLQMDLQTNGSRNRTNYCLAT